MGSLAVDGVSKAYKRYPGKWARVREWLTGKPTHEKTWVLRDIQFNVNPGEAVGIVGVNGAGKSTLLKIITGTTQPTSGRVTVQGRVAALLELGMGFHPDFTGRQNVMMAGQLLGHSPEEVLGQMPEIEAFAEVGHYMDRPLRVYSSGMQMRLAFSVATATKPDVLIVDEALSVGDAAFQRKCFRRIEEYRAAGTTLLFVSHDLETVKKLCDQAIFLKEGRVVRYGTAKQVCDEYERYLFGASESTVAAARECEDDIANSAALLDPSLTTSCEMAYGSGQADIEDCWLTDVDGRHINIIECDRPFRWCYRVRFNENVAEPVFAMLLKTREGVALFGVDSTKLGVEKKQFFAGASLEVSFLVQNPLAPGIYYFNCGVRVDTENGVEFLSRRIDAAILKVIPSKNTSVISGLVDMKAIMHIQTPNDDLTVP